MTLLMPKATVWQSSLYSNRNNTPTYVIHDQEQKNFILTEHMGLQVLELLNGERTPEQIQHELQARYGLVVEFKQLCSFLDMCDQNNLLVAGSWKPMMATRSDARTRGVWKSLGFHKILVSTEGLSRWLDAHRSLWFNPVTVALYAVLAVLGLVFAVWPWVMPLLLPSPTPVAGASSLSMSESLRQLVQISPYLGLGLLVAMLIEIGLHELGHTAACAYFKVNSKGWGVGLLWGVLPIFFTETSGVYTLNSKYKRILVSLAGPMVDVAVLGVCAAISLLTPPNSMLHHVSLAYAAVPLATLFINLNPFLIRMDGYWIAVDLLEKPNLRSAALRYFKTRLLQLVKLAPEADVRWADGQAVRDAHARWVYLGFFALSVAWTAGFVARLVLAYIGHR
jgi:putative peptide zinc metalloprotease protein